MEDDGLAGYAKLARLLNERFCFEPPVARSTVYTWDARGTVNRAGLRFPYPVKTDAAAKRTQPRRLFETETVLSWARAGIPGMYGVGWRMPGIDC